MLLSADIWKSLTGIAIFLLGMKFLEEGLTDLAGRRFKLFLKHQTTNNNVDKELKKEHQKYKNRFQQIEEKLAKLNTRKVELEAAMAAPENYANKDKFQQTETEYRKVTGELDLLNKEYETVFEKVMELEEKMG